MWFDVSGTFRLPIYCSFVCALLFSPFPPVSPLFPLYFSTQCKRSCHRCCQGMMNLCSCIPQSNGFLFANFCFILMHITFFVIENPHLKDRRMEAATALLSPQFYLFYLMSHGTDRIRSILGVLSYYAFA